MPAYICAWISLSNRSCAHYWWYERRNQDNRLGRNSLEELLCQWLVSLLMVPEMCRYPHWFPLSPSMAQSGVAAFFFLIPVLRLTKMREGEDWGIWNRQVIPLYLWTDYNAILVDIYRGYQLYKSASFIIFFWYLNVGSNIR